MDEWICSDDRHPDEGTYVLFSTGNFVGIAYFIDGDWDTVGANRRHYMFSAKEKAYSAARPQYWMPLPKPAVLK